MKKAIYLFVLGCLAVTISGCSWCSPFAKTKENARQTVRNFNSLLLDGDSQELYADK